MKSDNQPSVEKSRKSSSEKVHLMLWLKGPSGKNKTTKERDDTQLVDMSVIFLCALTVCGCSRRVSGSCNCSTLFSAPFKLIIVTFLCHIFICTVGSLLDITFWVG